MHFKDKVAIVTSKQLGHRKRNGQASNCAWRFRTYWRQRPSKAPAGGSRN